MRRIWIGPGQRRSRRLLPALPLAAGAKVMLLGHTFVSNGGFTSSSDGVNLPLTNITSRTTGELAWLRGLDTRFNLDAWPDTSAPYRSAYGIADLINGAAQGLSVVTLPDMLPALPYMIARRPDIVCLSYGFYDVSTASTALDSMIAGYDTVLRQLRSAGIWVIADTIAPVAANRIANGDARLTTISNFNSWLKAQANTGRGGLKVFDTEAVLGTARPNQTYWLQSDGLNLQDRGAFALANARLTLLREMVQAGDVRNHDPSIANLMPNASYAGSTGSIGTGVSGSVATNYVLNRSAGTSTIAAFKEASDVAGYAKQGVTITPVADGTTVHKLGLAQNAHAALASLGLAPGDWIVGCQYLELSAWAGWVRATWSLNTMVGTTINFTNVMARSGSAAGDTVLPTDGYGIWMEGDPFQIPASSDNLRLAAGVGNWMLDLQWLGAASGTGTCKVSKPILRKIKDPRTAWGL